MTSRAHLLLLAPIALLACSNGSTSAHDAGCDAAVCAPMEEQILAALDAGSAVGACVHPPTSIAAECAKLMACLAQCAE